MATSAIETAKQENGSKHFFQSMIEKNKEPSDGDMKKFMVGIMTNGNPHIKNKQQHLKNF